jgi:hypothetical protein
MKKLGFIVLLAVGLSACSEEPIYYDGPMSYASVNYEFYGDFSGTQIDGRIYNDGETFLESVELEIRLYDDAGFIVDYEYLWVDLFAYPGQETSFFADLPYTYIYDVRIFVNHYLE